MQNQKEKKKNKSKNFFNQTSVDLVMTSEKVEHGSAVSNIRYNCYSFAMF